MKAGKLSVLAMILLLLLACAACDGNRPVETTGATNGGAQTLPGNPTPAAVSTEAATEKSTTEAPTETTSVIVPTTEENTMEETTVEETTTEEPVTEPPTEPPTEAPTVPPTEASTEPPTETVPETPTVPEESTTQAAGGLWTPVPTLEADWATRAVCEQYYTNADFGFPTYVSPYDRDGDGIEDQADLLQGARDYVATRPEYDAGYFETGWPPAGKGVCTDVFNYAMLAAGYNMQELVDRDVHLRPWAYEWEVGDNKIDFRRTRNLLVFCDQYLEKLTLDPYDYAAWQPGDIVIFAGRETGMWPGHIAIVSDRRASDGLPYLIHHTDNDGFSYEQDFLTTPQRYIRGHYRVGDLASHRELFD